MPVDYANGETVCANLPDEPRLVWDVIPGVSIRVHGSYRRGEKAVAYQALYFGPFVEPLRWLVELPQERRLLLGSLVAGVDRYPQETPAGVVSDWLKDHGFPDWDEVCEPEPDCRWCWEPSAFRPSEWRLLPIWGDDIVVMDRTWRVGDKANTFGGTRWPITDIREGRVRFTGVGPRGGRQKCWSRYHEFAESNGR